MNNHQAVKATPFDLDSGTAYEAWRERKLSAYPARLEDLFVRIADPKALTGAERAAVVGRCRRWSMAVYVTDYGGVAEKAVPAAIGTQLGLIRLDQNAGADDDAISALQVSAGGQWEGYIPYTNRPLQWHTDGYYNAADKQVRSVTLHCVNPAAEGGENAIMDHEMAYLLLRDRDPGMVRALMAPDAMTIPPHVVNGRELRPERAGPVFAVFPDGTLHMRYTMRTRNVDWKEDTEVRAAAAALEEILRSGSPYAFRVTLQPGWGLISNNVLHDRTGFNDDADRPRLLYRARYYDRIADT